MNKKVSKLNFKTLLKSIGPGLLFASTAIGISHLVLSTRAGAHHGMIFFWVILGALILKYPFFEIGPRYVSATGHSLLKAYKDQGKWAIYLFLLIIVIDMFAVTAGVGAVSAGLLKTIFPSLGLSMDFTLACVLGLTALLLIIGGYKVLDRSIKLISVVLFISVLIAFFAVFFKGPVEPLADFIPPAITEGKGLVLLISLLGWMPVGMEASAMHSIWMVENSKNKYYLPSLKESLFDFNLGYAFTAVLALMFMTIGAYTVYGSGNLLEGSPIVFSTKLINIFTQNLGDWSYLIIAIAAFGTIYGTLITAWDAFARSLVKGIQLLKFEEIDASPEQEKFTAQYYDIFLLVIGIGAYFIFYFASANMIHFLEVVTILAFITAPIIAFLNLNAIRSKSIPEAFRPSKFLNILAYAGLFFMILFSGYYLVNLVF